MPELSRFLGLVITMYIRDVDKHHVPHIHVRYGEYKAVLSLTGELLSGSLPPKQLRAVLVWIDLREIELAKAWELAVNNDNPGSIAPLS
ncbi:MAG: DUF4160 domain-containing protein [Oscillospiraceae bacterium]|jgi:hypothetical protein|nr:DUF4160 domain-containing protein [Oscillospiraceae bacterium]